MDVLELTRDLVAFDSVSRKSNVPITDHLEQRLRADSFVVERLAYIDEDGVPKASVVAKKGEGNGGLALISHSDTVPADDWEMDPFAAVVRDGRLYGRGSCDMKGPVAATMAAAARFSPSELRAPVFIIVTADEETTGQGAQSVARDSVLIREAALRYGVVAEPTRLIPVNAHKGGCKMIVTARGRAAHSSTDEGVNANFLLAPFMAEMAALAERFRTEERFMNREFRPPTNGWNMVIDDGDTAANVTAAKSVCTLSFRPMPNDASDEIIEIVREAAARYGLEFKAEKTEPFVVPRDAAVVRAALDATGRSAPETVSYGTDSVWLRDRLELVVLGPGDICQAHTVDEWIDVAQLCEAVEVYARMIERFCM